MQAIEITGKSVDEATKAAALKLGVPEKQLKVTVVEQVKGLFGKSNVRVRAEVIEAKPSKTAVASVPEAKPARAAKAAKAAPAPEPEPEPVAVAAEPEAPAKKPRRGAKAAAAEPEVEAVADGKPGRERTEAPDYTATKTDAAEILKIVKNLISTSGLDVTAKSTDINGRYVGVELSGKDTSYLVGKHGEVLNAFQHLVNIIAGRKLATGVRATIDGDNYRAEREKTLTEHAISVAEEVKKRGEEAVFKALPAFERRIVHKALIDYAGVKTYSEGDEPERRVVIAPAD